jgi:EAL domain-containing protein (putative c-di-GMP-specific phosphodiesterase class I)
VSLELDDFGTGYSSLTYVRMFPIDALKIDRSFVQGVSDSPEDAAIVQAVISMGQALGVNVVAEGVESEDQSAVLQDLGCRLAQGFLFSRPVPASALPEMVSRR